MAEPTLASITERLRADQVKPCRLATWEDVAWLLDLVDELYREDSGLRTWSDRGLDEYLQARENARLEG